MLYRNSKDPIFAWKNTVEMSKIDTLCVHAGYNARRGEPRQMPLVQSTTFKYETSDQIDRKSTRLNSSHKHRSRMPSSA